MGLILKDTFSVFNFHRICELWCGESNGSISIFTICENIVTSHEIVNHYEPVIENINVLNLVSAHSPLYHEGDDLTVCSYVYPGKVKSKCSLQRSHAHYFVTSRIMGPVDIIYICCIFVTSMEN
jgi:hypothetical protein